MSPFDWGEYIEFAEAMLKTPLDVSDEAHWRIAVSRAYYGAFCSARNALRDEGKSIASDASAHGRVVHLLNRSTDRQRQRFGSQLKRMRNRRNSADYDDFLSPKFAKRTEAAVKTARRIVDNLGDE